MKELSLKSVSKIETAYEEHRDEEKLEKQLQAWRDNPSWIDQPPKVVVRLEPKINLNLDLVEFRKKNMILQIFLFAGEITKWFVLPFKH